MSDAYDLDAHDPRPMAQAGIEMPLLDPAGRRTTVVLRVRGMDCEAFSDMLKAQVRRRMELGSRKLSVEERNAETWELYATLVAGWSGLSKGGQPFEYSQKNAAQLLEQHAYIFEQVRAFAENRANFLPGSASS